MAARRAACGLAALAALAVAAPSAAVPPADAQVRSAGEVMVRQASTAAGQPVIVRRYASWRADCTSRGEPVVTFDPQPQHGTASTRPAASVIREVIGTNMACMGQTVQGTAVWYQPAPGFRGTDRFGITVNTGNRVFQDQAVIDVR